MNQGVQRPQAPPPDPVEPVDVPAEGNGPPPRAPSASVGAITGATQGDHQGTGELPPADTAGQNMAASSQTRSYRALAADKVLSTALTLERRVTERFPASGLSKVAAEVAAVARETDATVREIGRPILWARAVVVLFVVLLVASLVAAVLNLELSDEVFRLTEFLPLAEAALNDLVLLGAALFFLLTLETRIKRHRALRALDELRALAHVVDMHQLTKDPDRLLRRGPSTASSPLPRFATAFELSRYLDYCSELLALLGKIAALYAQSLDDPALLETVNEIETLTTGLSRKVWQKIMILERRNDTTAELLTDG